ncbi:MAG: single-stranded DNA-binding protein [Candidatus Shapirobacteria bacterium]
MAFSINLAIITGNVTRDPELRYTPSGSAVCTFGVATNHSVKKGDVWEDKPTFHNIVVWGKIAEYLTNTLKKGMKVSITGRIENRSYDAKDGTKKNISEIVADTVIPFSDHKSAQNENQSDHSDSKPQENSEVVEDIVIPDEMPF